MPARDWRLRVTDILELIAAIQAYLGNMNYDAFTADVKTVDAIVHRFTIIGEAANNIPKKITKAHPEVPWDDMREMRNVMVHVYFGVNTRILWDTIHEDLPGLVPQLQELLKNDLP